MLAGLFLFTVSGEKPVPSGAEVNLVFHPKCKSLVN
jgi:hypothetical protein